MPPEKNDQQDDTKPVLEPPVEPFEMPETPVSGPAPTVPPALPVKKSRKGLVAGIIVAVVLVLLAGTAAFAFMWYQSPDKTVNDALQNALSSKSVTGTGELRSVMKSSDGQEQEVVGNYSIAADSSKLSFDADATYNGAKLGLSVLSGSDQQSYFRVKNLKELVTAIAGAEVANGPFKTFVAKVSDKWIRIDTSGTATKQYTDQEKCYRTAFETFAKSKGQHDQVVNAYRDHPIFTIVAKGSEVINSVDSTRYEVKPNQKNYAAFVAAIEKTELFTALNTCSEGSYAKELDNSVKNYGDSTDGTTVLEVWVSKWQHQFTQVKITTKSKTEDSTVSFKPVFDRTVTITPPTESITLEEAYQSFIGAFMNSMGLDQTNPSRLQLN